jgi:hypothetical protein
MLFRITTKRVVEFAEIQKPMIEVRLLITIIPVALAVMSVENVCVGRFAIDAT